jgi:hypothetical protein
MASSPPKPSPPLKNYIITVDSSIDIYNGNLSSFTVLLPTRYRNIHAAQLIDVTIPGISNVYYEYMAIEGFNQLSSPSGGVNFAFAKIPLDGSGNAIVFADTNGYNYSPISLDIPISTLDRLQISFVDGRGNLVIQSNACTFQLKLMTADLSPYGGGSTITPNGRFLGGTF